MIEPGPDEWTAIDGESLVGWNMEDAVWRLHAARCHAAGWRYSGNLPPCRPRIRVKARRQRTLAELAAALRPVPLLEDLGYPELWR